MQECGHSWFAKIPWKLEQTGSQTKNHTHSKTGGSSFLCQDQLFVAEWFYRKGRSEAPAFLYVTNPSTGSLKGNKSITIFTLWNNFQNHNMQVNHARYLYSKSIFPWNHLAGQIGESQKKRFYFFCAFFLNPLFQSLKVPWKVIGAGSFGLFAPRKPGPDLKNAPTLPNTPVYWSNFAASEF